MKAFCTLKNIRSTEPNFTFPIPCIIIQLLQSEPTNALSFIKITIIPHHASCYMFPTSLVHQQGAHNCTKPL